MKDRMKNIVGNVEGV